MFEGWGAALVGAAVVGAAATTISSNKASNAQVDASKAAVAEDNYKFAQAKEILKPYTDAGVGSLTAQQDMLGLNGPDAQRTAIQNIQNSPEFETLSKSGETGILQNASATGGLRGGNTQAALAQFRPALLNQLIDSQFNKLGGITQIGQASAAGVGSAGITTGANNANLITQQGQAQAGNYLAQGQAVSGIANAFATQQLLSNMKTNTGSKVF